MDENDFNNEEGNLYLDPLGEDSNVFMVKRKPVGEPAEWTVDNNGDIVVEWKEKFERQKKKINPPFGPGEKLRVPCIVQRDSNGTYMIHADGIDVGLDARNEDNFFISSVPEPDPLSNHVGMPLEVILSVIERRKEDFKLSDIDNYDASFVRVENSPLVNPTAAQIKKLKNGKRVVVSGKFVDFEESGEDRFLESLGFPKGSTIAGENTSCYKGMVYAKLSVRTPDGNAVKITHINPPEDYHDKNTFAIVEAPDGRKFRLYLSTGKIVFSGGSLENMADKHPEQGDAVRIAAFKSGSSLRAEWCDPCYLDIPNEGRLRIYDELRNSVADNIRSIADLVSRRDYLYARVLIGDSRALELTANELADIRKLTADIPESERPVQTPVDKHNHAGRTDSYAKGIDIAYDVRLESMTKAEFVDFASKASSGLIKETGEHSDTSYLFHLLDVFGVEKPVQEEIIVSCIDARLSKVRGIPYVHDRDFHNKYVVDQALNYLAGLGTERSAQKSFDYLFDFVDNGDYHKMNWRDDDEQPARFLFDATEAINLHLYEMPESVLLANLDRLNETFTYLKAVSEENVALGIMEEIIKHIESKV